MCSYRKISQFVKTTPLATDQHFVKDNSVRCHVTLQNDVDTHKAGCQKNTANQVQTDLDLGDILKGLDEEFLIHCPCSCCRAGCNRHRHNRSLPLQELDLTQEQWTPPLCIQRHNDGSLLLRELGLTQDLSSAPQLCIHRHNGHHHYQELDLTQEQCTTTLYTQAQQVITITRSWI